MSPDSTAFWAEAVAIWSSGGWLMAPLLALTVFIYYSGLELLLRLQSHFIIRSRVHRMTDSEIATRTRDRLKSLRPLLHESAIDAAEVKRHFGEVRAEYLPQINRRIRFLAVVVPIGPLVGLLGTVTGMLSTFAGMAGGKGSRFDNVIQGISEALITTQTGLIISIPALVLLSLIVQRRNLLERGIARLERYNTCLVLKVGCPIPASIKSTPFRTASQATPPAYA
jgi:biopolymer transport protein ExbB